MTHGSPHWPQTPNTILQELCSNLLSWSNVNHFLGPPLGFSFVYSGHWPRIFLNSSGFPHSFFSMETFKLAISCLLAFVSWNEYIRLFLKTVAHYNSSALFSFNPWSYSVLHCYLMFWMSLLFSKRLEAGLHQGLYLSLYSILHYSL